MNDQYRSLKRKILWQVLGAAALTGAVSLFAGVVFIDGILHRPFADGAVRFFQQFLFMNEDQAIYLYRQIFTIHKTEIMLGGFIVLLIIFLYKTIAKLVRYFDQISLGVDKLLTDSEQPIILKPELSAMQTKLNKIKATLFERKRDAIESEQRKNDLVVYLAHDLKTPLTSVIGYLSLLQEASDMPAEQRMKYTAISLNKALRLEDLINEFFDITRFNLQNLELEETKFNLSMMLEQLADEFYPVLAEKNMKALVHSESDHMINGDANKLARVFNNLLKNAASYGSRNSAIDITTHRDNGYMHIAFKNKGKKIPRQQLDHIFEKFYRLDAARSSQSGGSGLGLAIAKKIVELHHGTITASSNNECTEFVVSLPVES